MKSTFLRLIDKEELISLSIGCTVLAGGGGGDPRVGLMMGLNAISKYGPVKVIDLSDLNDDDLIIPEA